MSKADTLGSAPAFGAARGARSSRRAAIDRVTAGETADLAALTELPVPLIGDNPDNPRNHLRNLDDTVESVRELGIILPIVVATTDAYLRDRPGRARDLDEGAQYIVVDGHRRLEAARRVGLATIPVRVDNARVSSDEALLEAAFVANYHRDDMTDLEEAEALQTLVDYYGSQTKAAKRLGIPQATISTKLSLLKLSPELQRDLVEGTRKVEHVRNLGKLSPEEQKAKADERAEEARRKAEAEKAAAADSRTAASGSAQAATARQQAKTDEAEAANYHGVIIPERSEGGAGTSSAAELHAARTGATSGAAGTVGTGTAEEGRVTQVPAPAEEPAPSAGTASEIAAEPVASAPVERTDVVPEPRTDPTEPSGEEAKQPRKLPYDDPVYVGMHLQKKMTPDDLEKMVTFLLKQFKESEPSRLTEALRKAGVPIEAVAEAAD